jgi:uncharacterized phage protein gp47/JayE
MPWPIPAPGDVANRAASVFETDLPRVFALKNPGGPPATVDARSNTSQLAVYARTVDLATQDMWFFQARTVQELMPDTAIDWLVRHAAIWGVPQIQAAAATGNVVFTGVNGTPIPSGLVLSAPGNLIYATTAAVTIAGTTATVPVAAAVPGSAGSQPAGTVLNVVNPLGGLTAQTAIVDSNGLTGEDAETIDAWRIRILAAIRNRGSGGSGNDFERWAGEALPGLTVKAFSPGTGAVTVAFAMPSGQTWRVPTSPEIATLSAYLNDAQNRKPLGTPVVNVLAATLQPIAFTLHLNPDNVANRAAATNALSLQILADATIGATIYLSRMQAALQNASGEFSDELTLPAADVTAAVTTLSTIGTVTFT